MGMVKENSIYFKRFQMSPRNSHQESEPRLTLHYVIELKRRCEVLRIVEIDFEATPALPPFLSVPLHQFFLLLSLSARRPAAWLYSLAFASCLLDLHRVSEP